MESNFNLKKMCKTKQILVKVPVIMVKTVLIEVDQDTFNKIQDAGLDDQLNLVSKDREKVIKDATLAENSKNYYTLDGNLEAELYHLALEMNDVKEFKRPSCVGHCGICDNECND